jgi:hypothetical protein
VATVGLCLALLCCCAAAAVAAPSLGRYARFPTDPAAGTAAGKLRGARAVASDPVTGNMFVVESASRRVSEFDPWGAFVKAFGSGVAPGPVNEHQEVRVRATGGDFKLAFGGSTTPDLPFDATGAAVEAALDALPSIGGAGGAVSVSGNAGNQVPGMTPSIYVIAFTGGPLAGADVEELAASVGSVPLSGGDPSSGAVVTTRVNGTTGSGGGDVCTGESGCQAGTSGSGPGEMDGPNGVAVDGDGDVYVLEQANLRVQKFGPAGEFLLMFGGEVNKTDGSDVCAAGSGDICGAGVEGTADGFFTPPISGGVPQFTGGYIALGANGTVYVGDQDRIEEFEPDGAFAGSLSFAALHAADPSFPATGHPRALAIEPESGDLYFSDYSPGGRSTVELFRVDALTGQPVSSIEYAIPAIGADPPARVYVESLALDADRNLFVSLTAEGSAPAPVLEFGPGGEVLSSYTDGLAVPEEPEVGVTGLAVSPIGDLYAAELGPGRQIDAVSAFGPPPLALAPPPRVAPTIDAQFASSVGTTTATIGGRIDPQFFADTTYYLEYGTGSCESSPCQVQPSPPGVLLTSQVVNTSLSTAGIALSGLAPATTYHYRLVAQSGGGGPVRGLTGMVGVAAEGTFTTLPPAGSQPSCPGNEAFRPGAAAFLPDCRAYEMVSPVDKNGADVSVLFDSIGDRAGLDQTAANGEELTYSAYRAFGDGGSSPYTSQYLATRVPGAGWVSTGTSPPREGPSIFNSPALDVQYKGFSADLCSGWLIQETRNQLADGAAPGFRTLYRRDLCGGGYEALAPLTAPTGLTGSEFTLELQGFAADGSRAFFVAGGALANGATATASQLYEVSGDETTLVCVLPNGTPFGGGCSAATGSNSHAERSAAVEGAISSDGSTVYWSAAAEGAAKLYVRLSGAVTLPVSTGAARFWTAAADGSRAVYSEGEKLKLFDLDEGASTSVVGGFEGLLGASRDARTLYLVSSESIGGEGVAGRPNLYRYEAGEPGSLEFIATLAGADVDATNAIPAPVATWPIRHTARVSPDGGALAFTSVGEPTGYDNADTASGEPDAEVYLYRKATDELICASCRRGGARPSGRDVARETAPLSNEFWAAALIPAAQNSLHAPRVLSDAGDRLFFESFDALSPRDVNGQRDVYEWEADGAGDCAAGVAGFDPAVGGCVNLISSGDSSVGSEIVDSSPAGRDVFFKTESSLLPQDPGAVDIYDARAGGGFAALPAAPQPCQGEACQAAVPPPASLGVASNVPRSEGNLKPKTKPCRKGSRRVARHGKPRCIARARKHKRRRAGR